MIPLIMVWLFGLTVGSCGPHYDWKISSLNLEISSQNSKINNLESELSWNKFKLQQLETKVNNLENKCISH